MTDTVINRHVYLDEENGVIQFFAFRVRLQNDVIEHCNPLSGAYQPVDTAILEKVRSFWQRRDRAERVFVSPMGACILFCDKCIDPSDLSVTKLDEKGRYWINAIDPREDIPIVVVNPRQHETIILR